jgi:hypothetical protein
VLVRYACSSSVPGIVQIINSYMGDFCMYQYLGRQVLGLEPTYGADSDGAMYISQYGAIRDRTITAYEASDAGCSSNTPQYIYDIPRPTYCFKIAGIKSYRIA